MEREAQQKQLKLSAPEKTDKNPNRKIHHLPPLVLLQLNAYILSFHYNWNLVLMEVFGPPGYALPLPFTTMQKMV